jgi:beta-lactam-binding protein with PASTA domain
VTIKNFLWLAPFCTFILGYAIVAYVFSPSSVSTPRLLSKTITQAILILSDLNLNARILREQEDASLPEGTVIHQIPAAGTIIKKNQSIFCIITCKPKLHNIPSLLGKTANELDTYAHEKKVVIKKYYLHHATPQGHCFGQFPAPHRPNTGEVIRVYISDGPNKTVLIPSLKDLTVAEASTLLDEYAIPYSILHREPIKTPLHECAQCTVVNQRPLSGTIVNLQKPPLMQLEVTSVR